MTEGQKATIREIGGRKFREIQNGNLQHDIYMMRLARLTGIDKIQSRTGESREDFAVRLHWQVLEADQPFDILAGVLIPEELADCEWTPAVAVKTGAYLRKLTDEAGKKEAQDALLQFNAFLAAGLLSSEPSRTASAESRAQSDPQHQAAAAS